jgi:hypothetical protein
MLLKMIPFDYMKVHCQFRLRKADQAKVKVILRPTVCRPVTRDQFFPFCIFLTVSGLLKWGALSDERTDLDFSVFAGHRQRSLSQI